MLRFIAETPRLGALVLAGWLALAMPLLAQTDGSDADTETAEGEGETNGEEADTETAEPPKPEMPPLTGSASGSADGIPFSVPVDCSGFGSSDLVRVQSDPGGALGEDLTADGVVLDATASRNRGNIDLSLSVSNTSYNFSGRLAQVRNQIMTYAVTLQATNGPDITIKLKVDCTTTEAASEG